MPSLEAATTIYQRARDALGPLTVGQVTDLLLDNFERVTSAEAHALAHRIVPGPCSRKVCEHTPGRLA